MGTASGDDLELPVAGRGRLTERLRLEPVGPRHAEDLWRLHRHDAVAAWHGGRWTVEGSQRNAAGMAQAWETEGVGKWMAYERATGELVGRGGLSRMDADMDLTRQVRSALPGGRWAKQRLEIGWTVRGTCGVAATRPRSAWQAWRWRSRSSAPSRWPPSPNGTTGARAW
jgi:hypothetical protein